eukprot:GDKH01000064.1.p1 GENE.GDKH01000064.1~~GDKH01000064.1.p1  ORF type:complete len:201 (-),score=31.90 GDKH01000064.1:165-767(-)
MGDSVRLPGGINVNVSKKSSMASEGGGGSSKVKLEKVSNVWGSCAGAGSDFFHIYRKHRTVELERLKQLDEEWEDKIEQEEYQKRRLERADEVEAKNQRKAEKRKRRRDNKKKRGVGGGGAQEEVDTGGVECDSDDAAVPNSSKEDASEEKRRRIEKNLNERYGGAEVDPSASTSTQLLTVPVSQMASAQNLVITADEDF